MLTLKREEKAIYCTDCFLDTLVSEFLLQLFYLQLTTRIIFSLCSKPNSSYTENDKGDPNNPVCRANVFPFLYIL